MEGVSNRTDAEFSPMLRQVLLASCSVVAGFVLMFQTASQAPTADEAAHLIAGLATWRTGDPGFYRVNPPLPRMLGSGLVELTLKPEIPGLYPASLFHSGYRREFSMADEFLEEHNQDYRQMFLLGRLSCVVATLVTAWMLVFLMPPKLRSIGEVSAVFWLTSPLVLGHGALVTPDAMSGTVMVMLIFATVFWWSRTDTFSLILCGIVWGIALSTKFTFCAVFLAWPIGTIFYRVLIDKRTWWSSFTAGLTSQFMQGIVALLVVIAVYNGSNVGTPLGKHHFHSKLLHWINERPEGEDLRRSSLKDQSLSILRVVPSPLPNQFLIGIDEQQLDLERGYPTYFLGRWYPNGIWWYYLIGLLAKEQVSLMAGMFVMVTGLIVAVLGWRKPRLDRATQDQQAPDLTIDQAFVHGLLIASFVASVTVLVVLSWHSKMALNVRYVFPALPGIFLLIAIAWSHVFPPTSKSYAFSLTSLVCVSLLQVMMTFPYAYSYANPLFGGSYRVPPVLHDSNFDGGQDLWRLEKWLERAERERPMRRYVCIHSRIPLSCLRFDPKVPEATLLKKLIQSRTDQRRSSDPADDVEVVVLRGVGYPVPWTNAIGLDKTRRALLEELCQFAPDEFVTPTIAIYRLNTPDPLLASQASRGKKTRTVEPV